MSGTDLADEAISLRTRYAMSGTESAYSAVPGGPEGGAHDLFPQRSPRTLSGYPPTPPLRRVRY
eukprot:1784044-Rhodomonas_salina.4